MFSICSYFRHRGFSGSGFDRVVERLDEKTVPKLQQQYWEAKQIYLKNIKRKEDDCIVSSDSELDAKLEVSIFGVRGHMLYYLLVAIQIDRRYMFHAPLDTRKISRSHLGSRSRRIVHGKVLKGSWKSGQDKSRNNADCFW